ncbi:hypothetical protein DM558_06310 [Entomomonas moraniae]|uniref:Lipoprotein n=1 Tax=Entomomonas moraniae TaxID=2213226 RepID=A0A3Q9JIQ5_9GAMM|nr:hypothetical protein [Entomomonas moraniae]AZS50411.1 hypothetical protein DM558_06310 [Entomomonas moraniae]
MKQIIIGIVLAVLLVGCGEKPKFSINESDTLETYANNPAFTKVKTHLTPKGKKDKDDKFGYQFTVTPVSVFGIETGDLNVIGGTIVHTLVGTRMTMTIKGKESFDKLEKRLNELKEFTFTSFDVGNSKSLNYYFEQQRIVITASYDSFSDITSFTYMTY